jgi:hypothetical protein
MSKKKNFVMSFNNVRKSHIAITIKSRNVSLIQNAGCVLIVGFLVVVEIATKNVHCNILKVVSTN